MPCSYAFHPNAYTPLPARALPPVPGINANPMGAVAPIGHTPWRVQPNAKVRRMAAPYAVRPTGGAVAARGNPGNPRKRKPAAKKSPSAATLHAQWAKGEF